jgi:hypothetical protein
MLKVVLIIAALFGVLLIFRLLALESVPQRAGLTASELKRYIKHLATALADRGSITLEPGGSSCELQIAKREPKRSPAVLALRFRSGSISRARLAKVYAVFVDSGAELELKRTRIRRLVKEIRLSFESDDPLTPTAINNAITSTLPALGIEGRSDFAVVCYGPFKPGFTHADGDVIPHSVSYRFLLKS